jgi:hypothetical protein
MTTTANKPMTDEELMAAFEQKQKAAKESKSFDSFYFFLKEDEKAVVRPLLNIPQVTLTETLYHEMFDRATGKMVADNVCAQPFGRPCKLCQQATAEKKLKATPRVFLPVYVHGVWKRDLMGELVAVTAKDESGVEKPIRGIRFLKLKLGSTILDDLKVVYYDSDERSICTSDFSIERLGSGLDTRYPTNLRKKVLPLPEGLPVYSVERVISDVRLHREEQAEDVPEDDAGAPDVEESASAPQEKPAVTIIQHPAPPNSTVTVNGPPPSKKKSYFKPISASAGEVTTVTVAEQLAAKEPTEKQLKEITFLCDLLGKDTSWKPLNWAQADNMLRSLREEHARSQAEE